jgi:hypothetical protein
MRETKQGRKKERNDNEEATLRLQRRRGRETLAERVDSGGRQNKTTRAL